MEASASASVGSPIFDGCQTKPISPALGGAGSSSWVEVAQQRCLGGWGKGMFVSWWADGRQRAAPEDLAKALVPGGVASLGPQA